MVDIISRSQVALEVFLSISEMFEKKIEKESRFDQVLVALNIVVFLIVLFLVYKIFYSEKKSLININMSNYLYIFNPFQKKIEKESRFDQVLVASNIVVFLSIGFSVQDIFLP